MPCLGVTISDIDLVAMAAMTELLKTDVLGRVRSTPAQREALLHAFACSGLSGVAFAHLHGVKYT